MRFCYLDESGTPDFSDPSSHFIFLGLSIAGETWKAKDQQVMVIKRRYGLEQEEVHAGWVARRYPEQEKILNFEQLSIVDRRRQVQAARDALLMRKAAVKGPAAVKGDRKNFMKTSAYIQLTGMVQMADVCAYATRRFCEYGGTDLFDRIFGRFNRSGVRLVGIRHYTNPHSPKSQLIATRG